MSLSLDLSSLTTVPKWRSDWNTAERRAIEQAKALRTMDKSKPQVVMDWVIKWVAVVDVLNAATSVVKSNGQEPSFSEEASALVEAKAFYDEWEKELEAVKAKEAERMAEAESVVDEDEEMSDATVGGPAVKTKGKAKVVAKVGHGEWRWPEEDTINAKDLIYYNPKCSYCEGVKNDRRCVGVEGAICFGCASSRKACSIYKPPPKAVPPPKAKFAGRAAKAAPAQKAGGGTPVGLGEGSVAGNRPSARAGGSIRKSKSASVIHEREPSPESPVHPPKASTLLRELEGKLMAWCAEGYKLAEEVRVLREAYLGIDD